MGQSGTSLHKRMRSNLAEIKKGGVLHKHIQEHHSDQTPAEPHSLFSMRPIKSTRTVLERLVSEGTIIQQVELVDKGLLMNSRAEWGRGKIVRFDPVIQRA